MSNAKQAIQTTGVSAIGAGDWVTMESTLLEILGSFSELLFSKAMIKGQAKRFYVFRVFRIDVTERVLFGDKEVVPLTPKAFDTLLVLVEHSGHVLTKPLCTESA
jgi:DNA-binding response OmpR family regulator